MKESDSLSEYLIRNCVQFPEYYILISTNLIDEIKTERNGNTEMIYQNNRLWKIQSAHFNCATSEYTVAMMEQKISNIQPIIVIYCDWEWEWEWACMIVSNLNINDNYIN